jgi:hypothetical protein
MKAVICAALLTATERRAAERGYEFSSCYVDRHRSVPRGELLYMPPISIPH